MKSKQKPKFLLVLLVFMAVLMGTVSIADATPFRISAGDLSPLPHLYDSSVDGKGLILSNYDLGAVDSSLSGILLSVNTAGSGVIKEGILGGWEVSGAPGAITYSFSEAVSFHFSTSGAQGPFPAAVAAVTISDGEITEFTGSPD